VKNSNVAAGPHAVKETSARPSLAKTFTRHEALEPDDVLPGLTDCCEQVFAIRRITAQQFRPSHGALAWTSS